MAELVFYAWLKCRCFDPFKDVQVTRCKWITVQYLCYELVSCNLAWTRHLHCTWRKGSKTWPVYYTMETFCLVNKLSFIHVAGLYNHVFGLRVISLAPMCNANASLIGYWHLKCYLIITRSNTMLKEIKIAIYNMYDFLSLLEYSKEMIIRGGCI